MPNCLNQCEVDFFCLLLVGFGFLFASPKAAISGLFHVLPPEMRTRISLHQRGYTHVSFTSFSHFESLKHDAIR